MRVHRRSTGGALFLSLLILGCTAPEDDYSADAAAEMMQPVSEDVLQQLESEYPVLGEAPVGEPQPARAGRTVPQNVLEQVTGEATYYADHFEGQRTASGIPFRQDQLVAAHRAYPFGTLLRVTNLQNDRSVNVRVVDRGPFGPTSEARQTIIDLSRRAATQLGYTDAGRTSVRVEVLEWGEGIPTS